MPPQHTCCFPTYVETEDTLTDRSIYTLIDKLLQRITAQSDESSFDYSMHMSSHLELLFLHLQMMMNMLVVTMKRNGWATPNIGVECA